MKNAMKALWSSLRVRLVVASLAWTAGLLYVAHVAFVFVMFGPEAFAQFGGVTSMMVMAVAAMVLGAIVIRRAIRSFSALSRRLYDVQEGRQRNVTGKYVSEVQPLVNALNGLLDHQDRRVRDALAKAGDLAHGLKTPLAVLSHEAERAAAEGDQEHAATLAQQVERMQRQIDYHLAHARAAASGATLGAHCSVAQSAEGIVRTLERLHAHRGLTIDVAVPAQHLVRGQREDLDEMLGNLLDNACKWAHCRVTISSSNASGTILITVEDDGPGIAPALREAVLQRGVRLDEAAPGSGFGLAIVRDLAELYGGSISLDSSPLGGVRASLQLPQAGPQGSAGDSGAVQVQ